MKQLFIRGTGRSRTTILKKILASHSQIVALPGELRVITDPGGALELPADERLGHQQLGGKDVGLSLEYETSEALSLYAGVGGAFWSNGNELSYGGGLKLRW